MRLYPSSPRRRTTTIAADVAVVLAIAVFAWLGVQVHDAVAGLRPVAEGVRDTGAAVDRGSQAAGEAIASGFDAAAGAVEGAPLVGGELGEALRGAGEQAGGGVTQAGVAPGGELAAAGERGEEAIGDLADLLGWLVFLLPTLPLAALHLPLRLRQVRRLTAAHRVLLVGDDPERRRLAAMRAAFALPYGTLLRHTPDPFGDLAAERHDRLLAALAEADG